MSPDLAVKVQLLLRVPAFREDLEKTAAVLGLTDSQKEEVVLRTAEAIDLGKIEKIALNLPTGIVGTALGSLFGIPGMIAGGYTGSKLGDMTSKAIDQLTASGVPAPVPVPDPSNVGISGGLAAGALGGSALGALLGNQLSDGGTLGTGLGAGLGGIGGAFLGQGLTG